VLPAYDSTVGLEHAALGSCANARLSASTSRSHTISWFVPALRRSTLPRAGSARRCGPGCCS